MVPLTARGTKLSIHANKITNVLFAHIQRAADQGTPFPAVKLTQENTALADVVRDSPDTLTIARVPHEHDGLEGIADEDRMTTARAIEWADVIMGHAFEYLGKNPDLVQHIDIYELVNEPSPDTLDGWYNLGAIARECVNLGRERYPSIAWGIGSFNAGEPEYDEMKAFLESGVLDGAPDDVVLTIHEGVLQPGDPIDKGQGDLIPGADSVPEHGGSLIGRIAYFAELAGEDMVPVVISEAYLQGYGDTNDAAERMRQMDAFYSELWYILAFCPFTHSPTQQWQDQDYTPAHALLFDYMADVADRENALPPVDEPDPPPPPPEPDVVRHTIHLLPQDTTGDELALVTEHLHPTRSAFTYSHDVVEAVMYHSTPEGKVVAWDAERWDMDLEQRFAWLGVGYEERAIAALSDPLHGLQLAAPFRKPFALTSRFNAPRNYANGLHEGADYDILGEPADSKEPVLAMRDGRVVISRWTDNAYGHYVVTEHEHNGVTFRLWFAHMDARFVNVGETVEAGQPVGELGGTGGNWAEHIHLNLQVPGHGLSGYAIDDVIDPDPYVSRDPVATTLDLLAYLQGDGRLYELEYTWGNGGGTHPIQTQRGPDNTFWIVKGRSGEYEELYYDSRYLYRSIDTSEAADRFYVQRTGNRDGAPWVPRHMSIGESFVTSPFVVHFWKDDCTTRAQGQPVNRITLLARYDVVQFESGIELGDVIHLKWDSGEEYLYARGYGLVGFRFPGGKSYIVDEHDAGESLPRKVIDCYQPLPRYWAEA